MFPPVNLIIPQGQSYIRRMRWITGPEAGPKRPYDLTGCTAVSQCRQTVRSSEVLWERSTSNGGIILGGALGTIQMLFPKELTATLDYIDAVFDFELTYANGTTQRLFGGPSSMSLEVTR